MIGFYNSFGIASLISHTPADGACLAFMSRAVKICAKPVGGKLRKSCGLIWIFKASRLFAKYISDPPELVDQIYVFTTRELIQVSQFSLGEGAGFGVFTPMQLKTLDTPKSVIPVIEHFISEHMSN